MRICTQIIYFVESARWARCKQGRARGVITGYQIAAILTWGPENLAQIQNILATAGATLIKMNKFHFLILSLILGFLNLTASENLPRTISIGKIKVGKILSTKNLASKNIKYFLDGEKASFVNLSKTQIMTLDFCCGSSGEIQRINVKFFDKNLTEGNIFQQTKRICYKFRYQTWRKTRANFKEVRKAERPKRAKWHNYCELYHRTK